MKSIYRLSALLSAFLLAVTVSVAQRRTLIDNDWKFAREGRLTKRQRGVIILLSVMVVILGFLPFLSNNVFAGFNF